MFYSYLFCFFGLDYRRGVDEGLGRRCAILKVTKSTSCSARCEQLPDTYILDLLNRKVSVRRHTDLFWLYIYDD